MGVSTDAILFYGYCWEDEARAPWELHPEYDPGDKGEPGNGIDKDDEDWEERYARLVHGLKEPIEPFPTRDWPWNTPREQRIYPPDEQAIVDKWSAHWTERRRLAAESGIMIDDHCSDGCRMPLVCIASTRTVNHRGFRTEITPQMLKVDPAWELKLRRFCEAMRIPIPDEGPKWWLVSWWG